ncbi:YciI family protein [Demequina phytophila]|uniref:YciI family protein n=1 Tax=Demequina phytophila TaxID=1638981 RepID=UPI000784334A|nr:YciI family protein [Demequina phytophila]
MPAFLIAAHHRGDNPFNLAVDKDPVWADLVALDTDLREAGALIFSRGLHGPDATVSMRIASDLTLAEAPGPLQDEEHWLSGMWLLECADMDEALAWGRRAARAHRCDVEVRPFQGPIPGLTEAAHRASGR